MSGCTGELCAGIPLASALIAREVVVVVSTDDDIFGVSLE